MTELQQGIYWDKGDVPPRHFAIAFLRVMRGSGAADVDKVLKSLAAIWNGLQKGEVPGLDGAEIPPKDLTWLIGFGRKAFQLSGTSRSMPRGLQRQNVFESVSPGGGNATVAGSGIRFSTEISVNPATEEIAVQFLANSPLATSRAIVETWTYLQSLVDPTTGNAPVMLSASYTGFNREDHRSWIGFHDGISNLRSGEERKSVIEIKRQGLDPGDRWTVGGTYIAFMRLAVDLKLWNSINVTSQEKLVGRKKIDGCPLIDIAADDEVVVQPGCPMVGTRDITSGNEGFQEPPDGVSLAIKRSHVQRANHHITPLARRSSQRFFRQGYEFIEPPLPGKNLRVGLNFVSFQEHPERLLDTLTRDTWLGATNFGGQPGPELMTAFAAGIYLCPSSDGEDYPGQSIFNPQ